MKLSDLENKDVVNMMNGKNIGHIVDMKINPATGGILSVILSPCKTQRGLFSKTEFMELSWSNIKKIGDDVILIHLS